MGGYVETTRGPHWIEQMQNSNFTSSDGLHLAMPLLLVASLLLVARYYRHVYNTNNSLLHNARWIMFPWKSRALSLHTKTGCMFALVHSDLHWAPAAQWMFGKFVRLTSVPTKTNGQRTKPETPRHKEKRPQRQLHLWTIAGWVMTCNDSPTSNWGNAPRAMPIPKKGIVVSMD